MIHIQSCIQKFAKTRGSYEDGENDEDDHFKMHPLKS